MKKIYLFLILLSLPVLAPCEDLDINEENYHRHIHWIQGLYHYFGKDYHEALSELNLALDLAKGNDKEKVSIRLDRAYVYLALHNHELALQDFTYVAHHLNLCTSEQSFKSMAGRTFLMSQMSDREKKAYYDAEIKYANEKYPHAEIIETKSGIAVKEKTAH